MTKNFKKNILPVLLSIGIVSSAANSATVLAADRSADTAKILGQARDIITKAENNLSKQLKGKKAFSDSAAQSPVQSGGSAFQAPEGGSIQLMGTQIALGQSEADLPAPASKGVSPFGVTCYNYSSDYLHYTKVSVSGGKVVGITTFDTSAVYDSVAVGGSYSAKAPSADTGFVSYKQMPGVSVDLGIDTADNNKVFCIVLTSSAYSKASEQYTNDSTAQLQREIFDMTNAYRTQHGISVLAWDANVANVAQGFAQELAGNSTMGHTDMNGGRLKDRLAKAGIGYTALCENVDAGYHTAEEALGGWINSHEGHRENLLNSRCTRLGVGAAYNPQDQLRCYTRFVQNFIAPL